MGMRILKRLVTQEVLIKASVLPVFFGVPFFLWNEMDSLLTNSNNSKNDAHSTKSSLSRYFHCVVTS